MAKKSISLKALIMDLKSGMDDDALMERHDLTASQLDTVFRKAVEKGGITEEQLASLRQKAKRAVEKPSLQQPHQPVESTIPPGSTPPSTRLDAPRSEKTESPETVPALQSAQEACRMENGRSPIRKIIFLLLLVAFIAGFIIMVKFLPWWASLAIVIAAGGATWLLVKYFLKRLFVKPFQMKGRVLAGADVTLHALKPADPPNLEADEDGDEHSHYRNLNWYLIDATIAPKDQSGPFTYWEPGELMLVRMDAKPEDIEDGEQEIAHVHNYRIFSDGDFREDEVYKHPGPQRIELHVGVKPGEKLLQFRYYFELFGKVAIPNK